MTDHARGRRLSHLGGKLRIPLVLIGEATAALWANRLRSFLTLLGVVMGVTSVITIVSTVEGVQNNIEDALATLGPKTFIVTRFGVGLSMNEYLERLRRKKLTRGLIEPIVEACPDCEHVGAEGYASDDLKVGAAHMGDVQLVGQTPNVFEMQGQEVADGRFLTWEDDRRRSNVVFIGDRVRERLFGDTDPIGARMRVGRQEYTVVGVAKRLGGLLGSDLDGFVIMPLSTLQKRYPQPGNPVNLMISAVSLEKREAAMDEVRVALRSARHLPYEADDDFTIMTPDAILSFINDFTRAFRVIVVSLPLLSIVVGGIVIMNIMMISVTERTREIGIRKSLGARRRDILLQFLYESLTLSLLGGLIGIGFGVWAGRTILTSVMDIQVTPTLLGVVLGVGISTAVGLFFGIYPASRAARLDPIKALGYE
jgi:putative ABC transport system permease protein